MRHTGTRPRHLVRVLALVAAVCVAVPVLLEAAEPDRGDALARRGSRLSPLTGSPGAAEPPCGAASAAVVAGIDAQVAAKIYADELTGRETREDLVHIRDSHALTSALSAGDAAATRAAVHALVYRPGWHIVRLRVLAAGRLPADVGGPYVFAPVSGELLSAGRPLARFVMSVQDDAGLVKLITRFIGTPVDLYRGRSFLMGTLRPAPALPASGSTIAAAGAGYRVAVLDMGAFPAGTLKVALFAPLPPPSLASLGCRHVAAQAWGSIAKHIAARFKPLAAHFNDLAGLVRAVTGASLYVVSGGRVLAGGKPPGHLGAGGSVRLAGRTREVVSWAASPRARVYMLTP